MDLRFPASRRATAALAILAALGAIAPAPAEAAEPAFDRAGAYAGVFAGAGRADNRIVDMEGFANWGRPGWAVDYDGSGLVAGALIGREFEVGGLALRIELDATAGRLPASSDRLDPEGRDETARSAWRWVAGLRGGLAQPVGPVTLFAAGGPAAARIESSVTDIDFTPGAPPRIDPDDSVRGRATRIGWTVGLGVEAGLSHAWTMRIEGAWFDFGRSIRRVNRSGDARCGPEGPRRPCRYEIRNRLGLLRLALIRRFSF